MARHEFYEEEGSKLLTPGAFEFVLDTELKRARRAQSFVTLGMVEAARGGGRPRAVAGAMFGGAREGAGVLVRAGEGTVHEVGEIIGREVRDTDLIGHTEQ